MVLTRTKVYLLFCLSGVSGLIYETVWLRILIRTLGNSVYATAIILASFMAGMALGSYLFGKYRQKKIDNLHLYAYLELGIGFSAIALIFLFRIFTPAYKLIFSMAGQERFMLTIFQSAMVFIALLVPTALMGGTLPVLARYTDKYPVSRSRRLGYLYGLNTLGAALGVFGAGIYTIGTIGEYSTLMIGVLINLCVALVALSFPKEGHLESAANLPKTQQIPAYDEPTRKLALFLYALSGFTAISYEVVWVRMLQIQVGTSVYAFSLMLTFYLLGIALGSAWGGRFIAQRKNALTFFAIAQLFIAFYSILGLYFLALAPPGLSIWAHFNLGHMLVKPMLIIFPVTFMLGFIFPVISKSYIKDGLESGSGIGRIYSVNTAGCIIGSLISGFLFIQVFGTRGTILLLSAINVLIGLIILYRDISNRNNYNLNVFIGSVVVVIFALGSFAPEPYLASVNKLISGLYGDNGKNVKIYYHKEGVAATATVIGLESYPLSKRLLINGIGVTSLCTEAKLMAHLPILAHQNPKDLLVICFGMGTTLRSASLYKYLRSDVVELVPETYKTFGYFYSDGPAILQSPRVKHFVDDGRNFLLLSSKKYDLITMDPSPPVWSAGTVNLYTQDFFSLCKERLNKNGIMCLWVPPCNFSEAIMIIKSFDTVFPETYVFKGPGYPGIYLLGFRDKAIIKPDRFIAAGKEQDIVKDLNELNNLVPNPEAILNLLVLNPGQLFELVKGVDIITDNHPYTEFPLWRSIFNKAYKLSLDGNFLHLWKERKFGK